MYRIFIRDVLVDELLNTPVLDICFVNSNSNFRIWVGPYEGTSIAEALCGLVLPRPNTHDIASKIISKLGAELEKVVITRVMSNTFYANMIIEQNGTTLEVDARPSDALAIAIRLDAPIFVTKKALEDIAYCSTNNVTDILKTPLMTEDIGDIKPEDFM